MSERERTSYRSDEERRLACLANGIDPDQHCCLDMAWFISNPVESESQGPNATMLWIESFDEYRINIPWGGHRSVPITYCPWCGTRLPETLRELWYETLHALGFEDPGDDDDIPPAFQTDEWWRNPVPLVTDQRARKDSVQRSVLLGLDLHPYDIEAMSHEAQLAAIAAAADDGRLLPGQVALLRNLGLLPPKDNADA